MFFNKHTLKMYKKVVKRDKISRLTHLFAVMHIFKVCDIMSVNSDIARTIAPDYHLTSCRLSQAIWNHNEFDYCIYIYILSRHLLMLILFTYFWLWYMAFLCCHVPTVHIKISLCINHNYIFPCHCVLYITYRWHGYLAGVANEYFTILHN